MGAGQSISSTLTRQKVFELTRDTRGLMDVLLEYMLKEITVRDFLALSNPTECKKYVIFLANNLYKHFYELQIVPIKDKKGVIAFRPVKELVNPPENQESDRQSLCLTLAYFYTRIFQIYGALALTVIDDSKFMMESGIIPIYGDTTQRGLLPPGYRPYVTSGGAVERDDTGTIPASSLGNFNFLRGFLYNTKDTTKGYLTRYYGEGESRGEIYFLPKIQEVNEFGRPVSLTDNTSETKLQKGLFFIGYTGAKKYATLEAYSKVEGIGGDTKFIFGKFKYFEKDSTVPKTIELGSDVLTHKSITIQRERPTGIRAAFIYSIKGSDKTITNFFTELLSKVVIHLKKITEGNVVTTSTSGIIISETGTADELKLARIVQNLTKTKPLGHCLARALQLLQTSPIRDSAAVSYICKARFFEQTTTSSTGTKIVSSRSGIPDPGSSLDTSPGLAALSQLFYDTVLIGTPKIVIGTKPGPTGKSSLQEYMEFMKVMGRLFGDNKFASPSTPGYDENLKLGLKAIHNKRDSEICQSTTGTIPIPKNVVQNVYDIVNQMYKTQVVHAAECGKIIRLLFDIQRDKSSGRYRISLSDNIIKKGFPEIERINFRARSLLVDYYSTCEMKYLQGVKIIIDAKRKSNAPVTTTSTPI
jgi:hypothetical protein